MQYIKTMKKHVAGSEKFFDVFKCVVDEVEEYLDRNGRKAIRIVVDGEEYTGMHNARVFSFLVANEGTESFIVLWKSNKGNYLVSYAWELWDAYDQECTKYDVSIAEVAEETNTHSKEAFVYLWINLENDKKYIGTHKGSIDDGYICSNERLLNEYNATPYQFRRTILAYGTQKQMHELETLLLIQLGAATGDTWYNLSNNLRK